MSRFVIGRFFGSAVATTVALVLTAGGAWAGPRFSHGQRERLRSLVAETRVKTDRAREELARARMDLLRAYTDYQIDERKVKAAQDRIDKAQLELLNLHLEDQIRLRRVMDAEQFERFTEMMRQRFGGFRGPPPEGAEHFVEHKALAEVGLTPDQRRRLRLVFDPEPSTMKIIEKLRRDSEQLIRMYSRYDLDEAAARRLIAAIHNSQQELAAIDLKNQQHIRSVLSQDQFERYRQAIERRMRDRPPWSKPPRR